MDPSTPSREDAWKQYQIHADLYRHYLEFTLKFNVFYYALAGAIASFCLSRPSPAGPTRYALLLPAVLGLGLSVVCIYGAVLNENTREELAKGSGRSGRSRPAMQPVPSPRRHFARFDHVARSSRVDRRPSVSRFETVLTRSSSQSDP
jgi:hypothetical protein